MENKKMKLGSGLGKNRIRNLLFLIVSLLIICLTVFFALKGENKYVSEAFGTTSDSDISMNEGDEIRAEFDITHEGFQGIRIKLFSEIKSFDKETLSFYLRDLSTNSIVAEHTMRLKNVIPQTSIFVPLPYEVSEETPVSVSIIGNDISSVPRLYVCDSTFNPSALYIDGIISEDKYLVLSAVYSGHSKIKIATIFRGIVYLLILLMIYLWPNFYAQGEYRANNTDKENVHYFLRIKRHRKWYFFVLLILIYFILAVFVYKTYIQKVTMKKETVEVVYANEGSEEDECFVLNQEINTLEQSFQVEKNNLSSLTLNVKVLEKTIDSKLHIQLTNQEDKTVYLDEYTKLEDLPIKRGEWKLFLDKEFARSKNKTLNLCIEGVDLGESEIAFYTGIAENPTRVILGGIKKNTMPLLKVSYNDNDFLPKLYFIFCIIVFCFLIMNYLLIVIFNWPLQKFFIPVLLYLGIIYSLIIPVYSVPDEYAHIDSAYRISNAILGIQAPDGKPGYDYKRLEDTETDEYLTYYTTLDDYRRIYKSLFSFSQNESLVLCASRESFSNANILYYVPAGIGITIGRLLKLGALPTMLLGRFANLACYIVAMYLCILLLPSLKELIFLYVSLPIFMQQAASFSYDCVLNCFALLFFACCISLAFKEAPSVIEGAVMLFTLVQLSFVKGGVYLPLCACALLILFQRKWKRKKAYLYLGLVGLGTAIAFLQGNIVRYFNNYFSTLKVRVSPFSGQELYSASYLIKHPYESISLFINTIFVEGSRLVYEFFGGKMGSLKNIQMPWMYPLFFIILLVVIIVKSPRMKVTSKLGIWICCFFFPLCSSMLVLFSMLLAHTSLGNLYISGLQGRYFYPVLFMPLVGVISLLPERKTEVTFKKENLVLLIGHIFFLFSIIMTIFA